MIAELLLLAVQINAAPVEPVETEIVVVARRLKAWRGKVSANARGSRCKTVQSTGDREPDQIACDTLRYCTGQLTAAFQAASSLDRSRRDERMQVINRQLAACGDDQQRLRVADLLARRAARIVNP